MPITAKLSRNFYETFGDDIANELVEWFNQVDATYRADLRELNELNFARFDATLKQQMAELEARLERRISRVAVKFEKRIAELDTKVEKFAAELRTELAQVEARLDRRLTDMRADLIRWMFAFWIGTLAPLAGSIVLLTR
jgi:DNA anti-recombination protein RmuC